MTNGKGRGISIGVFGSFYPCSGYVAPHTTGLVGALLSIPGVESVTVFCPEGSAIPVALASKAIRVQKSWRHDDPVSLVRTLARMLAQSSKLDVFLFNIYVTAFGRSRVANAFGLLLAPLLTALSRRPVVVYMHNFIETQDSRALGYDPTNLQRLIVRGIELILVHASQVVVPLDSQRIQIERALGSRVRSLLVVFAEPFGMMLSMGKERALKVGAKGKSLRVLLLGAWGPQKDLDGAIRGLKRALAEGVDLTVTITGKVNAQFPEYKTKLERLAADLESSRFKCLIEVPEARLLELVEAHDVLLLPYNATGGSSGAMMVGAYCGIEIVAYDLPQLRETAMKIGIAPSFIAAGDDEALTHLLRKFSQSVEALRKSRVPVPNLAKDRTLIASARELMTPMIPESSPE